ncbi:MAG: hypothetical protein ABFE07_29525 [Armatimonadia bacterium]
MTQQFPGFDPSYFYRLLSDFWDSYKEREQLACIWAGMSQMMDDMYLQSYQQDFGKSLETVPVYWRYQWSNFVLGNWEENGVFHKHYWIERTSELNDQSFNLGNLIAPEVFHGASNINIVLEGNLLAEGADYTYEGGVVTLTEPLQAGLKMVLSWVDAGVALPYHSHCEYRETLSASKATWTDADAFSPSGQGTYSPNDPTAPIELWVNGAEEPSSSYTETSATSLTLNVSTPPAAGDQVVLRWVRNQTTPNPHVHYKYNYQVHASREDLFRLPFRVTNGTVDVFVNGVLLDAGEYEFRENSLLHLLTDLDSGDLLEVEYRYKEYRWRHAVDARIVSAPVLQNGVDRPTLTSVQGVNHAVRDGYLYCDYCAADGFGDIWAPNLWVNESTIANNFGGPIGFSRDNGPSYLYGTRGLWNVYWHGPAIAEVEAGAKIVLDVPVSPADTTVTEVVANADGSHTVRLAIGIDFVIPSILTPIVVAGQAVVAYEALADGVAVYDSVRDPEWWRRIPGFHRLWMDFSLSEEEWTGRFDDRGPLDDSGFFDDSGNLIDVDQKLFELVKNYSFIVIVNSKLLDSITDSDNISHYIESIKPAYTKALQLVDDTITETVAIGETVSFELTEEGS